jgi:hypothetical protein
MNCSARTEEYVTGPRRVADRGPCFASHERTRDRQAAALYLCSAGLTRDDAQRDSLRRLAARLVLSNPY